MKTHLTKVLPGVFLMFEPKLVKHDFRKKNNEKIQMRDKSKIYNEMDINSCLHSLKIIVFVCFVLLLIFSNSKIYAYSFSASSAGNVIIQMSGRYYYKKYNGFAYVAYVSGSDGVTGPLLVSTNANAVTYYTSHDNNTFSYAGTINYNGTTFYYSSWEYWIGGNPSDTSGMNRKKYTTSAAALNSSAASREAAKKLLDDVVPTISVSNINYGSNLTATIRDNVAGLSRICTYHINIYTLKLDIYIRNFAIT